MNFIQAGFLAASVAAAIPIIVHLLNRWQVRQIELGTMRFLNEIIHDGAQRRKIRRWLLLATRIALVMLLVLLFARPFLPEKSRRDGDRLRVIMIDRSASMGMPGKSGRLVDDAVTAASESVLELGEDAKVLWAWFDRHVEAMPDSTTRPSAPRTIVGDTNYLAALAWARNRIDAFPNGNADVVLITDLQQSGLTADQLESESLNFPSDVPVRIVDVGRPAANNLAITNVSTPSTRIDTESPVQIAVTMFNYGTLPLEEVPLAVVATNDAKTVRLKKSINLPGGQADEIMFDFGKLDPGTWQVTASADVDDDLAADNRRLAAIEVAKPIDVLVLDSGSAEDGFASESYFLVAALSQSDRSQIDGPNGDSEFDSTDIDAADEVDLRRRFGAEVVYLQDDEPPSLDAKVNPLVIVADAGAMSVLAIERLEKYVRSGGRLLVFAGDGEGESTLDWWNQSGLAPGVLQPPRRSGVTPFRIGSLSLGTSMLSPFEDPQHGDLNRLAFQKLLPVETDATTRVHAWFDHERSAVTEHDLGAGRVVWFLSSADASWGNWTTSPLYLPMIQQMSGDLLNLTGEGPIRFRNIGDAHPMLSSTSNRVTPVAFREPGAADRGTNTLAPDSLEAITLEQSGFASFDGALYVVNGSARESDPTRIDAAGLAEHFGITLADATGKPTVTSVIGETRNELWPWLAAAALVLLIGEFALSNRTPA